MLVAGDEDFTDLFQLGIDFPGFDETQTGHNGFDTPMGDLGMDQLAMATSVDDLRDYTVQPGVSLSGQGRGGLMHVYSKISTGADSAIDAPATHYQQGHQRRKHDAQRSAYEPRIMVLPTPQSSEMQRAARRYHHYMEGDGLSDFDPYQRRREDQVSAKALRAL